MKPLNVPSSFQYQRQASLFLSLSQPRGCAGASHIPSGALPPISFYCMITISESQKGGKMGRVSYTITDDNRRRVELLTAFGILNGRFPTKEEIVNECIRAYFMQVYESYSSKADPNDMMLRMMEEVVS